MAARTRSTVSANRSGLQRGDPPASKRKRSNADERPSKRTRDDENPIEEEEKKGKGGRAGKKEQKNKKGRNQPRKTSAEKAEEAVAAEAAARELQKTAQKLADSGLSRAPPNRPREPQLAATSTRTRRERRSDVRPSDENSSSSSSEDGESGSNPGNESKTDDSEDGSGDDKDSSDNSSVSGESGGSAMPVDDEGSDDTNGNHSPPRQSRKTVGSTEAAPRGETTPSSLVANAPPTSTGVTNTNTTAVAATPRNVNTNANTTTAETTTTMTAINNANTNTSTVAATIANANPSTTCVTYQRTATVAADGDAATAMNDITDVATSITTNTNVAANATATTSVNAKTVSPTTTTAECTKSPAVPATPVANILRKSIVNDPMVSGGVMTKDTHLVVTPCRPTGHVLATTPGRVTDVNMHSPPRLTRFELQGASRTTGGIFRGKAYGNQPNWADLGEENNPLIPIEGRVFLYMTASDPASWDLKTMHRQTMKHEVTSSFASVLQDIGDLHSPVRRSNQRIYTHEEGEWMMKGRYDVAVQRDEELIWINENGNYSTHIVIQDTDAAASLFASASAHAAPSVTAASSSSVASFVKSSTALAKSGLDDNAFNWGTDVLKNPFLLQLATVLEVDPELTHRLDPSLGMWYKKYNAYNDAFAKVTQLKKAGKWELEDPGKTGLINLFCGRAMWHSHVLKAFKDIHNYESMVSWLQREVDEDDPTDLEVWGVNKSLYNFKDLGIWKQDGTLDCSKMRSVRAKEKEKGKAKAREEDRSEKRVRQKDNKEEGTSKKRNSVSGSKSAKSSSSKSQK